MATKVNQPILYNGTAMPYLALFDSLGMPVMNTVTGIPLGAYISKFTYMYDEEKENLATLVFDTGDPDTVDIPELQEGSVIFLQWGYVYPDGQFISGPIKTIKIRDFDCTFDAMGTHVTLKCIDSVGDLRFQPPYTYSDLPQYKFSKFIEGGCNNNTGVIIELFQ